MGEGFGGTDRTESASDTSGGGRSEPGPGTGAESVYEGTWATNGPDTGEDSDPADDATASDARSESASSGTANTADSAASTDGSASASHGQTDSGGTTAQADASGADGKRRRGKHVSQTGGTANAKNVGGAVGWATGVDGRHAVRNDDSTASWRDSILVPPRESFVLLLSTFISYPALIFSSVFPPFPLVVNVVVGACTLFLVAYLMSMPEVGTYVFGAWSVLATFIVLGTGIPVFSLLGLLILGSTWLPLGFTLLTYSVLRW
jgi:hypothetical protein